MEFVSLQAVQKLIELKTKKKIKMVRLFIDEMPLTAFADADADVCSVGHGNGTSFYDSYGRNMNHRVHASIMDLELYHGGVYSLQQASHYLHLDRQLVTSADIRKLGVFQSRG